MLLRGPEKRMDLATTMARLAGTLRIATPHAIVPWEIQRALAEVFDLPLSVPDLELFGHGVSHAFASPILRYTTPAEWEGIHAASRSRSSGRRSGEADSSLVHSLLQHAQCLGERLPVGVAGLGPCEVDPRGGPPCLTSWT